MTFWELVPMVSHHINKALMDLEEAKIAHEDGKSAVDILRASSHHLKKARECFNTAIEMLNSNITDEYNKKGKKPRYEVEHATEPQNVYKRATMEEYTNLED